MVWCGAGGRAGAARGDAGEQDADAHGPATERVWSRGRVPGEPGARQEPRTTPRTGHLQHRQLQRRPNSPGHQTRLSRSHLVTGGPLNDWWITQVLQRGFICRLCVRLLVEALVNDFGQVVHTAVSMSVTKRRPVGRK